MSLPAGKAFWQIVFAADPDDTVVEALGLGLGEMLQNLDPFPSAKWYFHRRVYCVLGIPIDAVGLDDVVDIIRQVKKHKGRLVLLTPNTNDIVQSQSNRLFRDAFLTSDISIADGMPAVWLARFLGLPILERVAGADLFESLEQGHADEMTVFFYGGDDGIAALACDMLNQSPSPLHCCGWISPGFGSLEDLSKPEYIDQVNRASPDLLVLSLGKNGKPWIVKNASKINRGVLSHLGAVINFVARRIERAPKGLQKLGLEWAWRIFQEPTLFRRYSRDALILTQLIACRVFPLKLQQLWAGLGSQGAELHAFDKSNEFIFQLRGTWTESSLDGLRRALLTASERKAAMAFDLSLADHMDSAVVGAIIITYGWQLKNGLGFRILAYSPMVARILNLHCASYLLDQPRGEGLVSCR